MCTSETVHATQKRWGCRNRRWLSALTPYKESFSYRLPRLVFLSISMTCLSDPNGSDPNVLRRLEGSAIIQNDSWVWNSGLPERAMKSQKMYTTKSANLFSSCFVKWVRYHKRRYIQEARKESLMYVVNFIRVEELHLSNLTHTDSTFISLGFDLVVVNVRKLSILASSVRIVNIRVDPICQFCLLSKISKQVLWLPI